MGRRGKSRRSLELVEAARDILDDIQPATVRAVCYRLFTMRLIDSMAKGETNRVSKQLTWAREEGIIPWHWIVDETREPERVNAWESPAAYVETVKSAYRRDRCDLRARVDTAIRQCINADAWQQAGQAEAAECESLTAILDRWPGISGQASKCDDEGTP